MRTADYAALMVLARRLTRSSAEAEDLLQDALIAGLQAGRPTDRAWLYGVMRNLSRMTARSDMRRRAREQALVPVVSASVNRLPDAFVCTLSPGLRLIVRLVTTGHDRAEIRHLLRISDEALRQRLTQLRRLCREQGIETPASDLKGGLAFGLIRQALRPVAARAYLASHDPDGHLFAINFLPKASQSPNPRPPEA